MPSSTLSRLKSGAIRLIMRSSGALGRSEARTGMTSVRQMARTHGPALATCGSLWVVSQVAAARMMPDQVDVVAQQLLRLVTEVPDAAAVTAQRMTQIGGLDEIASREREGCVRVAAACIHLLRAAARMEATPTISGRLPFFKDACMAHGTAVAGLLRLRDLVPADVNRQVVVPLIDLVSIYYDNCQRLSTKL